MVTLLERNELQTCCELNVISVSGSGEEVAEGEGHHAGAPQAAWRERGGPEDAVQECPAGTVQQCLKKKDAFTLM